MAKAKPTVKSPRELALMRDAGRVVAETFEAITPLVGPGITPQELDAAAERALRATGATPSFKGLYGFPATACVSVNDEIVHGVPSARPLAEGDLVTVDIGSRWKGYCGDAARSYLIGEASPLASRLVAVVRRALAAAIAVARPGLRLGDVSRAIEQVIRAEGFGVVREYGGHGIGRAPHEEPFVHNYVDPTHPDCGFLLRAGIVLALEPMATAGTWRTRVRKDWTRGTVLTADGRLAAHWEDTVAITPEGCEVLTRTAEGADGTEAYPWAAASARAAPTTVSS